MAYHIYKLTFESPFHASFANVTDKDTTPIVDLRFHTFSTTVADISLDLMNHLAKDTIRVLTFRQGPEESDIDPLLFEGDVDIAASVNAVMQHITFSIPKLELVHTYSDEHSAIIDKGRFALKVTGWTSKSGMSLVWGIRTRAAYGHAVAELNAALEATVSASGQEPEEKIARLSAAITAITVPFNITL